MGRQVANPDNAIGTRRIFMRSAANETPITILVVNDEQDRLRLIENMSANVRLKVARYKPCHRAC